MKRRRAVFIAVLVSLAVVGCEDPYARYDEECVESAKDGYQDLREIARVSGNTAGSEAEYVDLICG